MRADACARVGLDPTVAELVITVGEPTRRIKMRLEEDRLLQGVWVLGEISNWKRHSSGHCFFTLKDEEASVRSVLFARFASLLRWEPRDGMRVIAGGSIGVYPRAGDYQLYVETLFPAGAGDLYLAYQQLKEKLAKEGLFAAARKRPLPLFPRRVGVVTSPTGAAIHDLVTVLHRRFPPVEIVLAPALVQGEEAPASLVAALGRIARVGVDVVIIGRGGGSWEDLWPFNTEEVVRAIAACPVPTIAAVGHESDVTLADLAADLRAPTPSAAAELAVPELGALRAEVVERGMRLQSLLRQRLTWEGRRLRALLSRPVLRQPGARLRELTQAVVELEERSERAMRQGLQRRREALGRIMAHLESLSPLAVLDRGYSICRRRTTGEIVRTATALAPGERLAIRLARGEVEAEVKEISARARDPEE